MKLAVPYVATCREEKGCLFFEMNPSFTDPDVVTIAECFESAEAHSAHLRTPWFEAFWAELNHLGYTDGSRISSPVVSSQIPRSSAAGSLHM